MADPLDILRSGSVVAAHSGPCLLVHGGAWDIPDAYVPEHEDGLRGAIARGRAVLEAGGCAVDAVTETVVFMERHGAFDAGCGAVLTRKGTVELDAGVMDGETLAYGAVAAVHRIPTPVLAARALLLDGAGVVRLMVGEAAERFAALEGIAPCDPHTLVHARERLRFVHLQAMDEFHTSEAFLPGGRGAPMDEPVEPLQRAPRGTVGCVARDCEGRLAAATSTGGTPFRPPGRVGDSPLPGCGYYADRSGTVSTTGWGEAITAANLAGRVVAGLERGIEPEAAARQELRRMADRIRNDSGEPATGGLITLRADGAGAWAYTTPRMARGGWSTGSQPWTLI